MIGNKPPLLTHDTVNAGFQYHQPLGDSLRGVVRLDYQMIGRTWWDPYNLTSRDPVSLLDLRAGIEAERWSVTAWSKNLTNKLYNAEFSTGGLPVAGPAAPLRRRFRRTSSDGGKSLMAPMKQVARAAASHRLCHADQEKTRQFYEDVIGLPLLATWCESDDLFGKERTYCTPSSASATAGRSRSSSLPIRRTRRNSGRRCRPHRFITSRSRWTRRPRRPSRSASPRPASSRPDTYVLEHGYCRSVYVTDPNGLILEFTLDHPKAEEIARDRRADAHQSLKRWLAGDHTSNNTYR